MSDLQQQRHRQRQLLLQQREEEFIRQLDDRYSKTCRALCLFKDAIEYSQLVLLWRRPLISAGLVITIHMALWYLGSTEETLLTLVANIIFWLLLADAFWMAANKKIVEEVNHGNRSVASRLRDRMPWRQDRRETEQHKSLVEAYQMSQRALEPHELVPYEVVCLKLAEIQVWLSYLKLALYHWSSQQPFLFSILVGSLGAVFAVVGYFLSFTTLLYIFVMTVLVAPAVVHYDLLGRTNTAIQHSYPAWVDRVTQLYHRAKLLLSPPPEEEYADIQLEPAGTPGGSSQRQPPYNPQYIDPSMTLPPFDPADNPMDSLISFTPAQASFMSINSFFQQEDNPSLDGRPQEDNPSLALPDSRPTSLESIQETEIDTEALSSEQKDTPPALPLINFDPLSEDDDASTVQNSSTTDSAGEILSPVPNYMGMEPSSTTDSAGEILSPVSNYMGMEPPPPYSDHLLDWQRQPVDSSTPLGETGDSKSGLRHRDQ